MTDDVDDYADMHNQVSSHLFAAIEEDSEAPAPSNCEYEAHPVRNNQQLLAFDVKSRNVDWRQHIETLQPRGGVIEYGNQFSLLNSYRGNVPDNKRREVLIVHDMMNNYREDRHFQSSRKYDDYRFYHWPGIDYFCYFSHHYITIPPCGWTNAAHIHGVRMLGTFIVEHETGSKLLHEVLSSRDTINQVVDAMVRLCLHFVFEGWLVNIECKVEPSDMENLYYFVRHLRAEIARKVPHGLVFWYDSVIDTGELSWQNEINGRNIRFFRLVDGMLINYTWNNQSLSRTSSILGEGYQERKRTFFGIDVFGRGQVAKFQTRQTLGKVASEGFSTGIFAPGWTFETLQNYSYDIRRPYGDDAVNEAFHTRNEKFWWSLWDHLQTHTYATLPFYSDFNSGSGKCMHHTGDKDTHWKEDEHCSFFNLRYMAPQPSVPLHDVAERTHDDAFNGGTSLRITKVDEKFRLFATDFHIQRGGLVVGYAYRLQPQDGEFNLVLRVSAASNTNDCLLFLGKYEQEPVCRTGVCYVSPLNSSRVHLLDYMTHEHLPPHMQEPTERRSSAGNLWRVRYYVLIFDGVLYVRDIGVLYQGKDSCQRDQCYLGAVYCNEFDVAEFKQVNGEVGVKEIPIFGRNLLN